jgi:hypothetical protein
MVAVSVVVVVTVSVRPGGAAWAVVPVVAPAAAVVSFPIVERDTDEVSRAVAEVSRFVVLVSRGIPVVSRRIVDVSRLIPVVSRPMVVSLRAPVVSVVTGLGVVVVGFDVVVVSLRMRVVSRPAAAPPVVSVVGGVTGAGVGVGVGAAVVVSRRGVATAPAAELVSSRVVAPVSLCTRIRRVDVVRPVVVSVLVVVLPAVVSLVACATPLAGSAIVKAAAMPIAKHVLVMRESMSPSNRDSVFDIRSICRHRCRAAGATMRSPRHSSSAKALSMPRAGGGVDSTARWWREPACRDGSPKRRVALPE